MSEASYTLEPNDKVTKTMVGTPDMLVWGDLITKEQVRISGFLNTLAEEYVPFHDVRVMFLARSQQEGPLLRATLYVRLEEILLFFALSDAEPVPEETELRRFEPVEILVGSYHIQGSVMKSPHAQLLNLLLVARDDYIPVYSATVAHVSKPWLGTFSTNLVQVRRDRLSMALV